MLSKLSLRTFAWRPVQKPLPRWKIVKDDHVEVLSGKYAKAQGQVLQVHRKKNMVTVKGVNLKFLTVDDEEMQRRKKVVQKEFPIHVSNVALIDPEQGRPTKVHWGYLEDGSKVRVSKLSGAILPKPERSDLKYINRTASKEPGDLDTAPNDVLERTYKGEDFVKVYGEFQEYIRQKEELEKQLVFKK